MLLLGSCASSYSGFRSGGRKVCRSAAWQLSGTPTAGQKAASKGKSYLKRKSLGNVKKGKGRTHKASH